MQSIKIENDKFNGFLAKAFLVHISIVVIFVSFDILFNFDFFSTKKNNVDLKVIESAVRIDIVALPKFTLEELKKMDVNDTVQETKEEKIENSNETSKIEFNKKSKKLNLNNLLKNLSKKKLKKVKIKKQENKIDRSKFKKLVLEGNQISKGSSTSGQQVSNGQQMYISYIQSLPDRVKPHWKLPSYLLGKDLQARLRVFIAANGVILKVVIYQSSGDTEFDSKAIEAVTKSSPFPKPSNEILTKVIAGDVILGFPL
jgi:TonB family protein